MRSSLTLRQTLDAADVLDLWRLVVSPEPVDRATRESRDALERVATHEPGHVLSRLSLYGSLWTVIPGPRPSLATLARFVETQPAPGMRPRVADVGRARDPITGRIRLVPVDEVSSEDIAGFSGRHPDEHWSLSVSVDADGRAFTAVQKGWHRNLHARPYFQAGDPVVRVVKRAVQRHRQARGRVHVDKRCVRCANCGLALVWLPPPGMHEYGAGLCPGTPGRVG